MSVFDEFRERLDALSPPDATQTWNEAIRRLHADAAHGTVDDFLRWPGLAHTCPTEFWPFARWHADMMAAPDAEHWRTLSRDSGIGSPPAFSADPQASPLSVQHAYHLFAYQQTTGRAFGQADIVLEFGGGYGGFARLIRRVRPFGLHIVYDLPAMSAVQAMFLRLHDIPLVPWAGVEYGVRDGVCLISDPAELRRVADYLAENALRAAFVATWSLSEAPLAVRAEVFPRFLPHVVQALISYQRDFEGMSNADYFRELAGAWPGAQDGPVPHYESERYLFY